PAIITLAPSSRNRRAMARPRPEPPPVIRAVRPESRLGSKTWGWEGIVGFVLGLSGFHRFLRALPGSCVTRRARSSHRDAGHRAHAGPRRARGVGASAFLALRRRRGVLGDLVIWLFAPGESTSAGWSLPRPARFPAG